MNKTKKICPKCKTSHMIVETNYNTQCWNCLCVFDFESDKLLWTLCFNNKYLKKYESNLFEWSENKKDALLMTKDEACKLNNKNSYKVVHINGKPFF